MSLPDVLFRLGVERHIVGMTNIYVRHDSHSVMINHCGNPGDTMATVKANVDKVLGAGKFDELKKAAYQVEDTGNPNYLYSIVMRF